jgi:redox-sensitive bicupin YhaK (pirin superfamily)
MQNLQVRKSADRGYADRGWLQSYHSFSFAEYFDRKHMHFSALRVINDDIIAPGQGFGMHPHRDMEIITYILRGELQHKDNIGNGSIIKVSAVQRMTAGTGVVHSEFNASDTGDVHLLQIWIMPDSLNLEPSYEEKHFSAEQKLNQWCLIAARDNQGSALKVHQDMQLYASVLDAQTSLAYTVNDNRSAYLHIARGKVEIDGQQFESGDAVMLDGSAELQIKANEQSEVLLFDLPLHRPLGARD